jgi:GNAT superfamily N-acetyltransferase
MKVARRTSRLTPRSDAATGGPDWHPCLITEDKSAICADIIAELPQWFARPEANRRYVEMAGQFDMIGCDAEGQVAGFVSLSQHFDTTGEMHLLAARPRWHGSGLGRALVAAAEDWARARRLQFLIVKTLGPSHPDSAYAASRAFYRAMGFAPIEEIEDIWPGNPCLLLLKNVA